MKEFIPKVQNRKVEYIELIYDLIFVYLVGRNCSLLYTTAVGFIIPLDYFSYMTSTMVALQIWYLSSIYINHYGDGSLREHLMMFVNMYLLYYMAEGIRTDWGPVYVRYHMTWALLLLNMAVHYYLAARRYPEEDEILRRHRYRRTASLVMQAFLVLVSIPIYAYTGYALSPWALVFGIAVVFFTRGTERRMLVNFPHLAERVMLYMVFTFGEMMLGITGYFNDGFSLHAIYFSLMAFAIVVGLFSSYGYYYNHLLDEETKTSGLAYMILHIVMIFSLNNITAAMEFMEKPLVPRLPKTIFLVVSVLVFFICLLMTQRYSKFSVGKHRHVYRKFVIGAAVYIAAALLVYRWDMAGIALTAAFIFKQLYELHFGERD
ncbi:MAG: low temperature requirement protein A [Lachnospiraceae bacterium]|nr:low temperature requirement protein A [Lachnospiraceae bacterium]